MAENEKINFELVSPEKKLISAPVHMVVIPGEEGEFGVLANHASLVSTVRTGVVKVYAEDNAEPLNIFITGGFADVSGKNCTLLAEEAVNVADMKADKITDQIKSLEATLNLAEDGMEKRALERQVAVANAKLAALEEVAKAA